MIENECNQNPPTTSVLVSKGGADSNNNGTINNAVQDIQKNSSDSNSADGDDEADSDNNASLTAEQSIGSTPNCNREEVTDEVENEDYDNSEDNYEEEEDPAEYENTAPAYTMYGISDVNDDFNRCCIPDEDFDECYQYQKNGSENGNYF